MRSPVPFAIVPLVPIAFAAAQQPEPAMPRVIDLDGDAARQIAVRRVPGVVLGAASIASIDDGETLLCVHREVSGNGRIVLQKSGDGGRTWSEPRKVPESWNANVDVATIHRVVDARGRARLVVFAGGRPIRSSISTDGGASWTALAPIGAGGAPGAAVNVTRLANGEHVAHFHADAVAAVNGEPARTTVWQMRSADGGVTWRDAKPLWSGGTLDLCDPVVVRSADGKRLAMFAFDRAQQRSCVSFSGDGAATWFAPVELPPGLASARGIATSTDGERLIVLCRDADEQSATRGDWIAWVGAFADLEARRDGEYRVRLARLPSGGGGGSTIAVLRDRTIVAACTGSWFAGEPPFVGAVRLRIDELATAEPATFAPEPATVVPASRDGGWLSRAAAQLDLARAGGHRVAFVGDSITEAWGSRGKAVWSEFWTPRAAINLGIGGDGTQNVLWRLDHGLLDALAAANNDVRLAVVMIGTNNSNEDEHSAEEIGKGIVAVVHRLRAALPKAKVLLLAIFPRNEKPDAQRDKNATASRFAADALRGDAMVVCRDIGDRFVGADGAISVDVMPDFLHLSARAYRIWADAIVADVDALVR